MNDVHTSPIVIGSTRRLESREPGSFASTMNSDFLSWAYLTDVFLPSRKRQFVVDSFPFLRSLISTIYSLKESRDFLLRVGEGLELSGTRDSQGIFKLKIMNCEYMEHELELTQEQIVLFLADLTSSLAASIALTGIDVSLCLRNVIP